MVRQIRSRRAGGSARIVERLQSWQRGGGARTNTLGAPAVAKPTNPKENKTFQILEATRSMFRHTKQMNTTSHVQKLRSWRVHFSWFQYITVFGSNGTGVPDSGKNPLFFPYLFLPVSLSLRNTWYQVGLIPWAEDEPVSFVLRCLVHPLRGWPGLTTAGTRRQTA